jgi:hypothetical protein
MQEEPRGHPSWQKLSTAPCCPREGPRWLATEAFGRLCASSACEESRGNTKAAADEKRGVGGIGTCSCRQVSYLQMRHQWEKAQADFAAGNLDTPCTSDFQVCLQFICLTIIARDACLSQPLY